MHWCIIWKKWNDNILIRETVTYKATNKTYDVWYLYDTNDTIIGYQYSYINEQNAISSVRIYYEKDLQGNVIGLLDARGAEIATYAYDAWGNVTNTICYEGYETSYNLNHITYRGYYSDEETGFYYLQSRYYDPEIGRFINADDVSIILIKSIGVFKDNLYCYCNGDPVNSIDPSGKVAVELYLIYEFLKACAALLVTVATYWSLKQISKSFSEFCKEVGNGMAGIANTVVRGGEAAWDWGKSKLKKAIAAVKSFTTVARADAKIRSQVSRKSRTRYWSATLRGTYVDIGRPLSYTQAVKEVSTGRNVFTVTRAEAEAVARAANSNKKPIGPEIDKNKAGVMGYYYHYHVSRKNKGHVWYLFG